MLKVFQMCLLLFFANIVSINAQDNGGCPILLPDEPVFLAVEDEPMGFAEVMPRFPGCEDMEGTDQEKQICADRRLMQYLNEKTIYPETMLKTGIEGKVYVKFVVSKEGTLEDIHAIRYPENGEFLRDEALRVVEAMNELSEPWTAGEQDNKKVEVYYTVPIRFSLD